MGWLHSLFKPRFRTVQEAEHAALRSYSVGLPTIGVGLILLAALESNLAGMIAIVVGGIVVLAETIRFVLALKLNTIARNCSRCGTPNLVFGEDKHFKCVSCGQVVILRDV